MNIIICDDRIDDRKNLSDLLSDYGEKKNYEFAITEYESGEQLCEEQSALEACQLLFLDINCNLLEYLTQRDIQTKNSGVNVRYRGKHRFFKGFNEFIKEKTRRCDNDFEKIERHVFF